MITAAATAHLRDLHALGRPRATDGPFEIVSTAANLGGLGIGTLVSGALAQFVGFPLTVPLAVFAVLLLLAIVVIPLAPETSAPGRPAPLPSAAGHAGRRRPAHRYHGRSGGVCRLRRLWTLHVARSSLFLIAYLGLIVAVIGIGIRTLFMSPETNMLFFNTGLIVILAGIATLAVRAGGSLRPGT